MSSSTTGTIGSRRRRRTSGRGAAFAENTTADGAKQVAKLVRLAADVAPAEAAMIEVVRWMVGEAESLKDLRDKLIDRISELPIETFAEVMGQTLTARPWPAGLTSWKRPMAVEYGNLPFEEQLTYLREKVAMPTRAWTEVYGREHDHVFTVACANSMAIIEGLQASVQKAIDEGGTQADPTASIVTAAPTTRAPGEGRPGPARWTIPSRTYGRRAGCECQPNRLTRSSRSAKRFRSSASSVARYTGARRHSHSCTPLAIWRRCC